MKIRKQQLDTARIRPRYRRITEKPAQQVIASLVSELRQSKRIKGNTLENHAYIGIPQAEQKYWSPEMHVTVETLEEGSLVRGVIGPKPKIWTMYMFFYSAVVVMFFLGAALGVSQWMLKMEAPWLWSIPICIILYLLVIAAAKYGQYKSIEQMKRILDFLDDAVDKA
ncbi:MAG TPA: hypothetical protein VIN10_14865 [Bacteroidales bacterium]